MRKILATLFATALAIGIPATAASAEETASTCSYECTWQGETAWASGDDFAGANWAMFYKLQNEMPRDSGGTIFDSTPIYAGQHYFVGHAYFEASSDRKSVTIWIIFDGDNGDGARLVGSESVKVGYWDKDPSGIKNPPPGKLKYKVSPSDPRIASVTVPYNKRCDNFYAIHLDMEILSPSS
ncbi:hypothetical protein [Demequina maris]|uniref:hypothetical protein n=1 Tax=Demequina maris TaxID=1638982 RepID=UPI000785DA80|nr:hypothetical protein [Demequina maris]